MTARQAQFEPDTKSALTVVILTYNEERHIARAIGSVSGFAQRIVVVDSGSTDETMAIAKRLGAEVLENKWVNHATQFNWALDHIQFPTEWILRLDADEIVSKELAIQITENLKVAKAETLGFTVSRRMSFMGRPIRYGGLFPTAMLRLFRYGKGRCEMRWMDEHISVEGAVEALSGELLDDNLNSLTWWTDKHNAYASREVVDILNNQYEFMPVDTVAGFHKGQAGRKRWIKEKVYSRMPTSLRASVYFFYRYIIRFGFMDGREGLCFHVLQGFWYRFLVDAKLHEVKTCMSRENCSAPEAIRTILKIEV